MTEMTEESEGFTREDFDAFLEVVEGNYDTAELVQKQHDRVRWLVGLPGLDGRPRRIIAESALWPSLWDLKLHEATRERGLLDIPDRPEADR